MPEPSDQGLALLLKWMAGFNDYFALGRVGRELSMPHSDQNTFIDISKQ